MLNVKKKTRIGFYSVSLLFMILLGLCSTVIAASTDYQMSLTRGTEHYQVSQFNEKAWGSTVEDWFNGANDKSGAESKKSTFATYTDVWDTYIVMARIIFPAIVGQGKTYLYLALMEELEYDREYVNSTYEDEYEISWAMQSEWYYTIHGLNETANSTHNYLTLFKDPTAYAKLWRDYNDLARKLNSEFMITFVAGALPMLTRDEFLWKLALRGIVVGTPIDEYLTTVITELRCSINVEVNENILSFQKYGHENYKVEITYGTLGTMSSLAIKNADNNIAYLITTSHSSTLVYIILIFLVVGFAGLICYSIQRRKRIKNS